MEDLMHFKNLQIQALQKELADKNEKILNYETYLYTLCSQGCTGEYKDFVKEKVWHDLPRD